MRILIAGANGTIGGQLRRQFVRMGNDIQTLTRPGSDTASNLVWDPDSGMLDAHCLARGTARRNRSAVGANDREQPQDLQVQPHNRDHERKAHTP